MIDPARPGVRAAAIALLALAAYANTLGNEFVFDDERAIVLNAAVTGPFSPARIFSSDFWGLSRDQGEAVGTYRPIVVLTFAIDWHLGGGEPWMFHVTSALLHAAACVLFYLAMAARFGLAGWLAAGIFAVHPIHTEAVTSIVGRSDVIAFIFSVAMWKLHPRPLSYLCFAGALLTKESSILIVGLLGIRDLLSRVPLRALVPRYAGYGALMLGVAGARRLILGSLQGYDVLSYVNPLSAAALLERKVTALGLFGHGIELLFAPFDLMPEYGKAVIVPSAIPDLGVLLGALAIAGLVYLWREEGTWWLLIPGAFATNLVVTIPPAFAERLWYLPSAGACLLFARLPRRVAAIAGCLAIAGMLPLTWLRNMDWRTSEALFERAVAAHPEAALSSYNLSSQRMQQKRYEEAFALATRAAEIAPEWSSPHCRRAILLDMAGKVEEAERAFRAMLATGGAPLPERADYVRFLARHGRTREALDRLREDMKKGRVTQPIRDLEAALQRETR